MASSWSKAVRAVTIAAAVAAGCTAPPVEPPAPAPRQTEPSAVEGSPTVGATLDGRPGAWTDADAFRYRWETCDLSGSDCLTIAERADRSLRLPSIVAGRSVYLTVIGVGAGGSTEAPRILAANEATFEAKQVVHNCLPENSTLDPYRIYITGSWCLWGSANLTVPGGTLLKVPGGARGLNIEGGSNRVGAIDEPPVVVSPMYDTSYGGSIADPAAGLPRYLMRVAGGIASPTQVKNVVVRPAPLGTVELFPADVIISDSRIDAGIVVNGGNPVLVRNRIDAPAGGLAMSVMNANPAGIDTSTTDQNQFGRAHGIRFYNSEIPEGSRWEFGSAGGAVLVPGGTAGWRVSGIHVRGELLLRAGAIVKSSEITDVRGLTVGGNGLLRATGIAELPVVFTTLDDDSVGGDTDSGCCGTIAAPEEVIYQQDGRVDLVGVEARTPTTLLTSYYGPFSITDSLISGGIWAWRNTRAVLARNTFNGATVEAVQLRDAPIHEAALAGPNTNRFSDATGPGRVVRFVDASIPDGVAYHHDGSGAGVVVVGGTAGWRGRGVGVAGTLRIGAGAVVKTDQGTITAVDRGRVDVDGTDSGRVVFTSFSDDAVSGDTDGNGPTHPGVGSGAVALRVGPLAAASVRFADFRYSTAAITVDKSPNVSVRDTHFDENSRAITVDFDWIPGPCPGGVPVQPVTVSNNRFGGNWVVGNIDVTAQQLGDLIGPAAPFTFPLGWPALVRASTTDTVSWKTSSCILPTSPPSSAPIAVLPLLPG